MYEVHVPTFVYNEWTRRLNKYESRHAQSVPYTTTVLTLQQLQEETQTRHHYFVEPTHKHAAVILFFVGICRLSENGKLVVRHLGRMIM
jgi:hypothetical protein